MCPHNPVTEGWEHQLVIFYVQVTALDMPCLHY